MFSPCAVRAGRAELREFALQLQKEVTGGRPFDVLISGDEELKRLNRLFRRKPYPTDVLSFSSGRTDGFLGEIAISEAMAKAQAEERGHPAAGELRILMLHGVLHLTGLDHESDNGKMERLERRWRKHFNLPAGLIERALA